MPVTKCPECGREISSLAVACPGCGAPPNSVQISSAGVRLVSSDSADAEEEARRNDRRLTIRGLVVLGIIGTTIVLSQVSKCGGGADKPKALGPAAGAASPALVWSPESTEELRSMPGKAPPPTKRDESDGVGYDASVGPATVTYAAHKWGTIKTIQSVLIPKKFATEAGLIAVARRIDRDALDYQIIQVEIFDDAKAERLVHEGENLTKAELAFCDLHTLAYYRRNLGVNLNELRLYDNLHTGDVIKGSVRKIISLTQGEPTGGILSNAIELRRIYPTGELMWDGSRKK